jgi:large conductance mechanosensitive channel
MLKDFKDFLLKTNAFALAVGVIIGAATGKVVSAVVDDLLMPPISVVMPAGDWREAQVVISKGVDASGKPTVSAVKYGHFIGSVVDFTIIAFVVFAITKTILPKEPEPAPADPTKQCPECLETVPAAARKCKACCSVLAA